MIITAEDLATDPLTYAVLPMARKVAGSPEIRYSPDLKISFREHPKVLFLGHGNPGGELIGADAASLIKDLADADRGLAPGSELLLWSCFASAGPGDGENLVAKIAAALNAKGVKGVRISGVPGALYTHTSTELLYSGPAMARADAVTGDITAIRAIEGHAWAESGLIGPIMKRKGGQPTDEPELVTVKATIDGRDYTDNVKKVGITPRSLRLALESLVRTRKLAAMPADADIPAAILAGVTEWYRVFFAHPIIQAYVGAAMIKPWDQARLELTTTG